MIFLHEKKEEIDKENVVKSLKEIGQEWKNLPNIVKQYYKEKENDCNIVGTLCLLLYFISGKNGRLCGRRPCTLVQLRAPDAAAPEHFF